ncbi:MULTISPECIES: YafY family protein [unclassified Sphingopyxis]|jgi:predicted DNA-binding transcriptional regulator YafY|uniref:helix-turn-helix transcriptional regulator n=1 Tax=unclassified Sphingopyxis TaxID=2614943 RepID=UPI0006C199B4|nr:MULTISPECIES: WYL domain-containing protein [unclassified Sphingopyxis]USI77905.1 WYL domain-containing protein [Sphingopyxis sp. USTB-05]GAO79729.1 transcriptional regulator, DeoR family [Sphingopyxis sp. C-1]
MRASRLLSILILLQLRQRLTAADLAAEFEVSERTIYRDIDALSAAGVPVYGDRGPGGGFQLLDGYHTRLTGLSAEEAEVATMIGLPGPAAELGLGAATSAARGKLLAAIPGGGGAVADRMAARFHLDPAGWYRSRESLPSLPTIARAVFDQRLLAMRYDSWQGLRDWTVEPLGLVLKAGVWYLAARGAGKIRVFRVSNIFDPKADEATFEWPKDFRLPAWWQGEQARFEAELFATAATVRASPEGCKRLAQQSPRGADAVATAGAPDERGWREMTLMVEDSDHGAREMIALGAEVEVVVPDSFRARIGTLAQAIAVMHG